MPVLFQYLVKLSCSLALVYLFYQVVLRRLTFYTANRWYLLGYSVLCFFIPFINITPFIEQNRLRSSGVVRLIPALDVYTSSVTTIVPKEAAPFTIWDGCLLLFVLGVVILLARLVIQLVSYRVMKQHARLITKSGIPVYQVDKAIIPFSFGHSIFINRSLHNETELTEIIRHEFVHVRQRHTVDIIWMELLCIANWYNPFAWALRHAARQNLEFIADNKVIENGMDKKEYQYLLLKVIGQPQFRIAAPFNFSSLKKRIVMMNKLKSAKVHLVKFLFALPLLAVLLVAFRNVADKAPDGKAAAQERTKHEVLKKFVPLQYGITDTVPAPPKVSPPDDYKAFLARNPGIRSINWTERHIIVQLKSGKREIYLRDNEKSLADAKKKYGALLNAPPPAMPDGIEPPAPPDVAEPPAPDTTILPEEAAALDEIERLQKYIAQLNDSIKNASKENTEALKSYLNERSMLLQKEHKALQTYLQAKQVYLRENQAAAAKNQNALLMQLQQRQAALEQDQKASQEHFKKMQEEFQKKQKAAQHAKDDRSSFVPTVPELNQTVITADTLFVTADTIVWNAQERMLTFSGSTIAAQKEVAGFNGSAEVPITEKSLVLLDGKQVALNKSFANYKGGNYKLVMLSKKIAQKKYGEKGRNGVLKIETL